MKPEGIISYLGLSSELKGTINRPDWYFDTQAPLLTRSRAMDLLMMIQGWRYYDLEKVFGDETYVPHIRYAKEYWQYISGKVSRAFSER